MLILYYKNYKQSYLGHFSNFFASNFQDNTRASYNTWLSMKIFGFSLSKNVADKFWNSPTKYNHFPKYFWGPWLKIRPHSCVWNTLINSPWKLEFKILENVGYIPEYNFVWSILEELNCQFSENWHVSCRLMLDKVFHDFTLIVLMIFESSNCVQLTHDWVCFQWVRFFFQIWVVSVVPRLQGVAIFILITCWYTATNPVEW